MNKFQIAASMYDSAKHLIERAEADLGPLSDGQRRDLLKDNLELTSKVIAVIVSHIRSNTREA